ncbi:MAG: DNA alkylation repair protein [Puniceicoccales bacterium]|jgi:3-methyladenine DNA glycosylase AlkD|nr:DNA alkylation repair protein [Puniceicoccales bacterium]
MPAEIILQKLFLVSDPERAATQQCYFKTGKGQYAEGDVMLGVTTPLVKKIVKETSPLSFAEIQTLLDSRYHEARMVGLQLLVKQFQKTQDENGQQKVFDFYLKNARKANNWDLVDASCPKIVGAWLLDKTDRSVLYHMAKSDNLWEQRIAIVATWMFIKHGQLDDTLHIAEKLLSHKHDLIHKATGWMLREVGKKNKAVLIGFLDVHRSKMPRTMLRYAIERFSAAERSHFMRK